ncbi:MAG: hypothetical protein UZ22_OP11002000543 [Microgenomates bacterium OLB23]|nr:MAG: hypothetical protein UZ22_OP11002000543 [Microgenomates bacterium OLB23]
MNKIFAFVTLLLLVVLVNPANVSADHSWGGYHWARTQNPFTVKFGNNVSNAWGLYLYEIAQGAAPASYWRIADLLEPTVVTGNTNASKGRNTPKTAYQH